MQRSWILRACTCLLPAALSAQSFTTFTEWTVPTAFSNPREFAVNNNQNTYFTELGGSKVGFLDFQKNTITEWVLPQNTLPLGLVAKGQKLALGQWRSNGKVAVLDPNGSSLTEWDIPQILGRPPVPMHIATQGKYIYFTDNNQGVLGMVNTSNDQMTLWPLAGAPARFPNGIVAAGPSSAPQIWVGSDDGRITLLNPANNTVREWLVPRASASVPGVFNLAVGVDGEIIFHDFYNNTLGVFNPSSNIFRQWFVPTANSAPVEVAALASGIAAFTEFYGNKVGILDLTTTPAHVAAVAPTTSAVNPVIQVVAPRITALPQSVTPVIRVVTGASRVVTGGFAEYPVPTANSIPGGLAIVGKGAIVFAEVAGNKIGLLQ